MDEEENMEHQSKHQSWNGKKKQSAGIEENPAFRLMEVDKAELAFWNEMDLTKIR